MVPDWNVRMAEVTRLTRAGRLGEAMALIRGLLRQPKSPGASEGRERKPSGTGFGGGQAADRGPPRSGSGRPRLPEAVLGLLGRLEEFGGGPGRHERRARAESRPSPDGARFVERIYADAAGGRTYKLYVPSHYNGEPLPLIVMLHGCHQSPDDFAAGTRMNALAEEQGFLVAYPEQSSSANPGKCWNWFNAGDQLRDRGEPSLIAGITRQIMRDFAIDPARVHVAGMSAGGAAAAIMGAVYPDLYRAIGVHSGLAYGVARDLPSAFAAMRQGGSPREGAGCPVPTIVFHGDRDATVNPVNADQVIAQSKAAARLHTTVRHGRSAGGIGYTRTIQTDRSGHPILEQWVLHGAGHAWSGGSPAGSFTDPRGPDASREMLRFFRETCKRAPA